MILEPEPAEFMTTDVMSTTLVSATFGEMAIPMFLAAIVDEAVEVVVNDGSEEECLVVESVGVGSRPMGADVWVVGLGVDVVATRFPMKDIEFPCGRAKKSFDVSQHPSPPASAASGRFASQQ